jgi:hypothetical protein
VDQLVSRLGSCHSRLLTDAAQPGHAKVEQLRPRPGQHDVGRLHILVDDAVLMREGEPLGYLRGNRHAFGNRQPFARHAQQARRQRLPFQGLHHQEGLLALVHDVVKRADVRVGELRYDLRLALHARSSVGFVGKIVLDALDGDEAVEPGVAGQVHFAHPAFAQT